MGVSLVESECSYRYTRHSQALMNSSADVCVIRPQKERTSSQIVLVTHGSIDRLDHIALQSSQWSGPVFASILVHNESQFPSLVAFAEVHSQMQLALVLVSSSTRFYPINMMRNIAVSLFDSENPHDEDFLLLLDADAIPGQHHDHFLSYNLNPSKLYILPAFDLFRVDNGLPTSKFDLLNLIDKGSADIMHAKHPPSYSFDFHAWAHTDTVLPFSYQLYHEPYVLTSLSMIRLHRFDEGFVGRGYNKQAFHFELWLAHKYQRALLLPHAFVINLENPVIPISTTKETVLWWHTFRQRVARQYGRECRESHWRLCDERGIRCDKVCNNTNEPVINVSLPSSPETLLTMNNMSFSCPIDVVLDGGQEEEDALFFPLALHSVLKFAPWARTVYGVLLPSISQFAPSDSKVVVVSSTPSFSTFDCVLYFPPRWILIKPLDLKTFELSKLPSAVKLHCNTTTQFPLPGLVQTWPVSVTKRMVWDVIRKPHAFVFLNLSLIDTKDVAWLEKDLSQFLQL